MTEEKCACGHEHHHEHMHDGCGNHHEHAHDDCGCGHHHEHAHGDCGGGHEHHHHHAPGDIAALRRQKKVLAGLQQTMSEIQSLHDKIDSVLARVTVENVGLVLTQKKTLRELKTLAAKKLGGDSELLRPIYAAEQAYIADIEDIMHHAQLFKRATTGQLTAEVVANISGALERSGVMELPSK